MKSRLQMLHFYGTVKCILHYHIRWLNAVFLCNYIIFMIDKDAHIVVSGKYERISLHIKRKFADAFKEP
jgi:hypothetical protein